MRIAIIGGGVSGLAAAYHLDPFHAVTLFEREPRAGGHARTEMVAGVPVDTGFIVYNDTTYPGFSAFLRDLGVGTVASEMSFGVRCAAHRLEWSSRGLRGFLASPGAIRRTSHWRMLWDMERFYRDARGWLREGFPAASLGVYLREADCGDSFAGHYLRPLAASVWSTPPDEIDAMPLEHFVRFIANHGMIGWGKRLRWRTVRGGSREYVARIESCLGDGIRAGMPVVGVRREAGGACVTLSSGEELHFDAVVLATHADDALTMLTDADDDERAALSAFRYTSNRVVLHTDAGALPRRADARASWNYTIDDCRAPAGELTLTYDLNRLQRLPGPRSYCVSVNPRELDPAAVVQELEYRHPRYDARVPAAQRHLIARNGARATYFAGAHLGYGFHEDGYVSGRRVAELLGATR